MGGGGYFLVVGEWGCIAGWGRIFTTEMTITGLYSNQSYFDGMTHFRDLGDQKIQVGWDLKMGRFLLH